MDAARELAQLLERARSSSLARGHARLGGRRVAVDVGLDQPQLHRDRDQPLLRAVVQVALEPPPLGVAGGDQPLPRGVERSCSSAIAAAAATASISSGSSSSAAS